VNTGSWEVSSDLQVREIRPGVFLHTSWRPLADGTRFPSNGLVVREGDGLLLIDTAWGEPATEQLLGWIDATLRLPVEHAVATHFHDDRLGGAPVLARRGLRMVAHPLTRELAQKQGLTVLPDALEGLRKPGDTVTVGSAEVLYPGPGHARDNVVVWLPESRVVFGGCMIRALAATGLGNVADADVPAWPESVRRAFESYGSAEVVVPGHGDPGGPELFAHTLELLGR
jgi:glyoxylase-like metal-dependent hydrolase (beta-lactamase superfamily II)